MIDVPTFGMEVDNPAEILSEQDGEFEVTSPYGYIFHVVCRRGRKMDIHEVSEGGQVQLPRTSWRIRRLARSAAA